MAHKLGQLWVVPKPQREHVAVATDDDCFPPAVFQSLLSNDEMTRCDVGQVRGRPVATGGSSWSLPTADQKGEAVVQSPKKNRAKGARYLMRLGLSFYLPVRVPHI